MEYETVAQCWHEFRRQVIPLGAPAIQIREMRRAFYAGAWMMLQNVTSISEQAQTLDAGAAILDKIGAELKEFRDRVSRGEM